MNEGRSKRRSSKIAALLLAALLLQACSLAPAAPQSGRGAPSESVSAPAAPAPEETAEADAAPEAAEEAPAEKTADDGVLVEQILGHAYRGYLITVLDPARVILSCVPEDLGRRSRSVEEYVSLFGGVAGVNAGGFLDVDGKGNGASPDSLVVYEREIYCEQRGTRKGFAGLDGEHRLVVALEEREQILEAGIEYAACFGPVLIVDGRIADREALDGYLNPRTAIGQRADGAILLLIIEGRQLTSMGASCLDLAEILLAHGAVTACNLDGGRSTAMWYGGQYLRSPADVQARNVPNAFIVLPSADGLPVLPAEELPVWTPEEGRAPAGEAAPLSEEDRARLEDFAGSFAEAYIAYLGARSSGYRAGYSILRRQVVPDSALDMRIRNAFGGMELTRNGKNLLQSLSVEDLRPAGEGAWSCSMRFTVRSIFREYEVETELAMRVSVVERNGKLLADDLWFYK